MEASSPAVAMTPVCFAKGTSIKESDAHNGIYFNKWIAREQANLVVEAGAYMSRVPGVAGGDYRGEAERAERGARHDAHRGEARTRRTCRERTRAVWKRYGQTGRGIVSARAERACASGYQSIASL